MSFASISLTKASRMAPPILKGNLDVYSFQISRTRRNRLFANSPNGHSQLLRVLLNCFSQCHFLVRNSVLCLYKNHPLGESPSKFVHTCLHVVFIFLFHGPWPSGCWPQREKNAGFLSTGSSQCENQRWLQLGWKTTYWVLAWDESTTERVWKTPWEAEYYHSWLMMFSQY